MSIIVSSKDAFKKGAKYEDGSRVLTRAAPKQEPSIDEKLLTILAEIRKAVELNAKLIEKLQTGDGNNFSEQIAANQAVMVQLLTEIKRAGLLNAEKKPIENKSPEKWTFKIKRVEGELDEVIATKRT